MILTALGWPLGLFFAGVCVSVGWRMRKNAAQRKDRGSWITGLMFGCAAIADFTAVGLLPVRTGAVLAGLVFAAFLSLAQPWRKGVARSLRSNAATGTGWLGRDARSAGGWMRSAADGLWARLRDRGPEESRATGPSLSVEAAVRAVPSLRSDAALGPVATEAIAAASPAADPLRAAADWIAGFEAEDDVALIAFVRSVAAGFLLIGHAVYAQADTCMSSLGLDPAFVAGLGEIAEKTAELGHDVALVDQRFHLIYDEIQRWIESGRVLPNDPKWLTGGAA